MKAKMLSKQAMDQLHHIHTGFESSLGSIEQAYQQQLIDEKELTELLKKNSKRLIDRLKDFKLAYRLTCFFFAALFVHLQVSGEDMDLRRPGRTTRSARHSRVRSSRKGKRDEFETEFF